MLLLIYLEWLHSIFQMPFNILNLTNVVIVDNINLFFSSNLFSSQPYPSVMGASHTLRASSYLGLEDTWNWHFSCAGGL